MRKISIYTNHFFPEQFRINDLASELSKKNSVEVVTQIPNYPIGKYYRGYGLFSRRIEKKPIKIYRLFSLPRYTGKVMLALNYISYVISSSIFSLSHQYKDTDAVLLYVTSPIFISWAGIRHGNKQNVPKVMYLLDLWPHNLYSMMNIKYKWLKKWFDEKCLNIYNNMDCIFVSSPMFIERLVSLGVSESKINYLPQHAPVFSDKRQKINSEDINIYFIGNFGSAQNLDYLLELGKIIAIKSLPIKINLVGDEGGLLTFKREIVKCKCNNIFEFHGYIKENKLNELLTGFDFGLVLLREDDALTTHIPARVQTYLAHGLPIISYGSLATEMIITENDFGFVLGIDRQENCKKLQNISALTKKEYMELSKSAYEYALNNFKLNDSVKRIEDVILDLSLNKQINKQINK